MDSYKVETLDYTYEWLDVGPGPREKGHCIGMTPTVRRYNKPYHTLDGALKALRRLQGQRYPANVIIVSKKVNGEYMPGKLTIQTRGKLTWSPVRYVWKRNPNTKINFFELISTDGKYEVVHQNRFFKVEPTFAELVNTVFDSKLFREAYEASSQTLLTRGERSNYVG